MGPASEKAFSQLLPEGTAMHHQHADQADSIWKLLRDLEHVCVRKLEGEADRKEEALRACRSWVSRQEDGDPGSEVQRRWIERLEALIEHEWGAGQSSDGGTIFRKLKPKILAEWRTWRQMASPGPTPSTST